MSGEESFKDICISLKEASNGNIKAIAGLAPKFKTKYVEYMKNIVKISPTLNESDKEKFKTSFNLIKELVKGSGQLLVNVISKKGKDTKVNGEMEKTFKEIIEELTKIEDLKPEGENGSSKNDNNNNTTIDNNQNEDKDKEEKEKLEKEKENKRLEREKARKERIEEKEKEKKETTKEEEPVNTRSRTSTRLLTSAMVSTEIKTQRKQTIGNKLERPVKMSKEELEEREKVASGKIKMEWKEEVGEPDLIKIENLSVESLLENIKIRYDIEKYYTYCGTILVALNPYYPVHNKYYTQSIIQQYTRKRIGEEPPHLFAIADSAYRDLTENNKKVSIIISGESGAGKTETTKLIVNYLSAMNNKPTEVEAKLVESSSLLEAFGNAKTQRNRNSSRFGKYIKIMFKKDLTIAGAQMETYLLEKSRVTIQPEGERNYHFFYQLCAGASSQQKKNLLLKPASEFNYLKSCTTIGLDESREFSDTMDAMSLFGLDNDVKNFICQICAAILHLGELEFVVAKQESVVIKNKHIVDHIAKLLQIDNEKLNQILTSRLVKIPGNTIQKPLNNNEATSSRDALAREIYSRLFLWIVIKVNKGLEPTTQVVDQFMGILDIFGFENFRVNSFEQLCINFANEKLHQQFIEHVFKLEQKEYQEEEIAFENFCAPDNEPTLKLIEGAQGIFSILDEESRLQSSSDKQFIDRLESTFKGKHTSYDKPRLKQDEFIVKHFAEDVSYHMDDFRKKNANVMAEEVMEVISSSKSKILQEILELTKEEGEKEKDPNSSPRTSRPNSQRGKNSVSSTFKKQLVALKITLDKTSPYYVRCIKPNLQQKDHLFAPEIVGKQLAYSGMVETVKIRKMGYPSRFSFQSFWERYFVLSKNKTRTGSKVLAKGLLETLKLDTNTWQIGKSKVFLKTEGFERLDILKDKALAMYATKITSAWKMYKQKKIFKQIRKAARVFQKNWRVLVHNRKYKSIVKHSLAIADYCQKRRERAAIVIKKNWRVYKYNKKCKNFVKFSLAIANYCQIRRDKAALIKKNWKIFKHNRRYKNFVKFSLAYADYCQKKREKAAEMIKRNFRAFKERRKLKNIVRHSLAIANFCHERREKAAALIKKNFRVFKHNRKYKNITRVCYYITTHLQKLREKSAITIKKNWRVYKHNKKYKNIVKHSYNIATYLDRKRKESIQRIIKNWRSYKHNKKYKNITRVCYFIVDFLEKERIKTMNENQRLEKERLEKERQERLERERIERERQENAAAVIKKNWKVYKTNKKYKTFVKYSLAIANYVQTLRSISAKTIVNNWRAYKHNKKYKNIVKFSLSITNYLQLRREKAMLILKNWIIYRHNKKYKNFVRYSLVIANHLHKLREEERVRKELLEKERLESERIENERLEKERLENERIEKERLEKERLENEKLEQERLEKEKLEKERLEKERLEKLEQERLENERLEKERLEKERIEKERLEQERLEKEKLEKERLEKERLEKLEQERLENERLEKEKQEKEERERLERLEQERLENERLEKEKQEREEKERLEMEKLQKLEQERLDKEMIELENQENERLAQLRLEEERLIEEERLEQERLEKERKEEQERIERMEQERLERIEREKKEKLEQEKLEKEKISTKPIEDEEEEELLEGPSIVRSSHRNSNTSSNGIDSENGEHDKIQIAIEERRRLLLVEEEKLRREEEEIMKRQLQLPKGEREQLQILNDLEIKLQLQNQRKLMLEKRKLEIDSFQNGDKIDFSSIIKERRLTLNDLEKDNENQQRRLTISQMENPYLSSNKKDEQDEDKIANYKKNLAEMNLGEFQKMEIPKQLKLKSIFAVHVSNVLGKSEAPYSDKKIMFGILLKTYEEIETMTSSNYNKINFATLHLCIAKSMNYSSMGMYHLDCSKKIFKEVFNDILASDFERKLADKRLTHISNLKFKKSGNNRRVFNSYKEGVEKKKKESKNYIEKIIIVQKELEGLKEKFGDKVIVDNKEEKSFFNFF